MYLHDSYCYEAHQTRGKRSVLVYKDDSRCTANRPEVFGARIQGPEVKTGPPPLGVGDAMLINPHSGIFAVADSPDWNPAASKEFLTRFDKRIEEACLTDPDLWHHHTIEKLTAHTNRLIDDTDINCSTTFTCLFVLKGAGGLNGLIFHCGDSCLFKVDLERKTISQLTWTNMDMVGRADKLSQVEVTEITAGTRFIICSDGLQALSRNPFQKNLEALLLDSFSRIEVDEIPDYLIDHCGKDIEFPDDMAVITLNPNKLFRYLGDKTQWVRGYDRRATTII